MVDQYSQDGEPLDIFGSDPFGRNYLYGLSGNGDGQGLAPYGTRYAENLSQPTTAKRGGYFGNIGTINDPMTEFSSAFEVGGRTVQYPLIVPTLTVDELQLLRSTRQATPEINQKAQQFALDRLSRGQDPFATTQELRYPQPQGLNPAPITGEIRETPRSFISGLFSDVLGGALNMPDLPKTGVPSLDLLYANRNPLMKLMGVGDVQKTAERISYGEPLTSGAGGLGGTSRLLPETFGAAMTVAPFAPVAGRVAGRMIKATEGMPVGMGIKDVGKSSFEYMASHRPVTIEGGASTLDNLIPSFGEDIYGKNALQYFGTGSPNLDRQALSVFQQVKGNPNATVTVYRAIPKNVEQQSLNSGDWVTISRDYARQHGESTLGGNYKLVEQQVPASSLTTNADSILEQGYYPKTPVETPPTYSDPFGNTIGSSIR